MRLTNLITFRQLLHQYPEKSGEEKATAQKIATALADCQPSEIWTNIGGHGVVAIFDSGVKGETLSLIHI